jgi:N-acetylglucosaminyltransferase
MSFRTFVDVALNVTLAFYLLDVVPYLVLQVLFAGLTHRRRGQAPPSSPAPSVDVIIPCYNEDPRTLAACLDSISAQDYPGEVRVHVVDDGSPNLSELSPVYREYSGRSGFRVICLPENRGKRHAQVAAITTSTAEIVVGVDSDTMIAPDGLRQLIAGLDDAGVGAVMGEMLAANTATNWLTRLIDMRYWYACNQERAAQSHFGAVLCCCGPFSAYRREVLERVLDSYVNQAFRKRRISYGEDRYLTNLVLGSGMRTQYVPRAQARTVVPQRIRPFLRQQLRWNRCTYRDMAGIARRLPSLGSYIALDAFTQTFAPALLALSLLLLLLRTIVSGSGGLVWYCAAMLAVALGYCAYGAWRNRDLRFLYFALYGAMHLCLLVPVRIRALFTLTDDRWGKRGVSS